MPWKPSEPGEVPSLGGFVIDWIAELLAAPDRPQYEPFVLYPEQEDFVYGFYELDPKTCRRKIRRGVISRPRGWGKSPLLAALACVEALGPVVPAGWDAYGQPVAKSWADVRTPLVQIAAVSEAQTKNTWQPLLEMLRNGPVIDEYIGLEPLDTMVNLPSGVIERITSSARTVKGNKGIFAVLDQTEEWVKSNGGLKLAETIRINAAKIGGSTVESPNAYTPGEGSVAESSAAYYKQIEAGEAWDDGLYYDHREAPPETNVADRESLTLGLRWAYGDSSNHPDGCLIHDPPCPPGHSDIERLVADIWDPSNDIQTSRADFLNQITHASDAFTTEPAWKACLAADKVVARKDVITLGFDGSRGRHKGKPDATALIGCRVSDGHLFEIGVWEARDLRDDWENWSPPIVEIEAAIAQAFRDYTVVAFYADPGKDWRSYVNAWEAKYGSQVTVKVSEKHPFEWWMTGGRSGLVERAVEALDGAINNAAASAARDETRELTHDGSFRLTQHMLHARRRLAHGKLALGKEHSYSSKKIDAAVAAVLAWQARLDAIAAGVLKKKRRSSKVGRIY